MEKSSIKKVYWQEIREKVVKVNPNLARVIDQIDPSSKFPLYLTRYPYGSTIVDEGIFHLPSPEGNIIPIDHSEINSTIKDDLIYSGTGIPSGIVLENTIHEAVISCHRILPLGVVLPGAIFALWKKLDVEPSFHPINMFTITAGARFIFMVPNVSNILKHKKLKRDFNVSIPPPKELLDQWEIFKSIAYHKKSKCNWSTELLFFSKSWFEKIKNDSNWQSLYLLMLEHVWKKSGYERNHIFYELAFSRTQENRNLKPNPYLTDTIKHLFMIAAGVVPGFAPAINNACAPIDLFKKVYIESYQLDSYPTIFIPKHFTFDDTSKPIYYSLTLPTTLEFAPKSRKVSSTMNDLSELKHVLNIFLEELQKNKLKLESTSLAK